MAWRRLYFQKIYLSSSCLKHGLIALISPKMARWVFWAVSGPLFLLIIQRLLFQLVDSNIISRIEKPPKSEFSLVEIELVPGQDSSRSKREGYSCSSGVE